MLGSRRSARRRLSQQTLLDAKSRVSACEDFITARRGAVGAEARTRLAEAGRLLHAGRGDARSRILSRRSVRLSAPPSSPKRRPSWRSRTSAGSSRTPAASAGCSAAARVAGGNGAMGAILGGILINSVLNGGGGRWRPKWRRPGAAGRGGGGGFSPGSFGGGGTRSRRGGGRF